MCNIDSPREACRYLPATTEARVQIPIAGGRRYPVPDAYHECAHHDDCQTHQLPFATSHGLRLPCATTPQLPRPQSYDPPSIKAQKEGQEKGYTPWKAIQNAIQNAIPAPAQARQPST